eukprot:m.13156 g.13156  ORF g.13156 m.13156 type:complete len:64 (-) comp4114_c1_seq1:47-238(-)
MSSNAIDAHVGSIWRNLNTTFATEDQLLFLLEHFLRQVVCTFHDDLLIKPNNQSVRKNIKLQQ